MSSEREIFTYCGGEAADELFGGPFNLGYDWIENVSPAQLLWSLRRPWATVGRRAVAKEWWAGRRGVRPAPLPIDDELSPLFRSEIRDEYLHWRADQVAELEAIDHPYRHLILWLRFDGWLRQNWEVCSELRVRRSLPFWCRETIELAFRLSPSDHALPPKRLVVLGMAADVPALNLARSDKGAWNHRSHVPIQVEVTDRMAALIAPEYLDGATRGYLEADLLAVVRVSTGNVPKNG